jgi:hypothetical protein
MGTRDGEPSPLWVVTADLPVSPGHPFYARLNALLDANQFDRFDAKVQGTDLGDTTTIVETLQAAAVQVEAAQAAVNEEDACNPMSWPPV